MVPDLNNLKVEAKHFSILYAEDNDALRKQASTLLKKFFADVDTASDGAEALRLFKEHHYKIVLSDIKMPKLSGIELSRTIKAICPDTKIIIMSAFDDKEHLLDGIEIGIFRFLKKPVTIVDLAKVLLEAIEAIHQEENTKIFYAHLKNIFNYQNALTLLYKEQHPILANEPLLEFFNSSNLEAFTQKYGDIGTQFKPHSGFLFSDEKGSWLEKLKDDMLYHVKMLDQKGEMHHFILKMHAIPEQPGYSILSLDDVTDLKLLALFDEKSVKKDTTVKNQKALLDLLHVVQRNSAKVQLHNFYKGLTITNDAIISEVKDDVLILKTNFLEQKALQFEGHTVITSEALPHDVECKKIDKIDFDAQNVSLKEFSFMTRSPTQRKSIRLEPEEEHKVTLFFNEHKFFGDVRIEDVSVDAVKLALTALPAGLIKGETVVLDMVFEMDKKPLIINTKATLLRSRASGHLYHLVFTYELNESMHRQLVMYISKRQMALIREFKGLQYGR
jgi:CheY-like chemotaxis protein